MNKMMKAIRPKILKKRMPKAAIIFFVLLISFLVSGLLCTIISKFSMFE